MFCKGGDGAERGSLDGHYGVDLAANRLQQELHRTTSGVSRVHVGVGFVGDQCVGLRDEFVSNVAMEVESDDVRPDHLPDRRDERFLSVM